MSKRHHQGRQVHVHVGIHHVCQPNPKEDTVVPQQIYVTDTEFHDYQSKVRFSIDVSMFDAVDSLSASESALND